MGNAFGGGADDAKRKSATHAKREAREGGNLAPCQGLIGVLPILALDGPELAVVGLYDEINTLIGGRQLEFLRDGLRHFAVQPNVLELAGILRFQEQIGFDEFLEHVALLLFGQVAQLALNVRPRGAASNCAMQTRWMFSLRHKGWQLKEWRDCPFPGQLADMSGLPVPA
jgi:hypothetical protein